MKKIKKSIFIFLSGLLITCCLGLAFADNGPVNINTASKEVLMTLKGVGEVIADRIIEYRKIHPFQVPEDIMKVKGFGPKMFEANKNRIVIK